MCTAGAQRRADVDSSCAQSPSRHEFMTRCRETSEQAGDAHHDEVEHLVQTLGVRR